MAKVQRTITLDFFVNEAANKQAGFNVSHLCEQALMKALNIETAQQSLLKQKGNLEKAINDMQKTKEEDFERPFILKAKQMMHDWRTTKAQSFRDSFEAQALNHLLLAKIPKERAKELIEEMKNENIQPV